MFKKVVIFMLFVVLTAAATLFLQKPTAVFAADSHWKARYWNNRDLKGDPVLTRDEEAINYDWGDGSPSSKINDGDFSARWTRTVYLNTGTYRFTATMDDGMRAWVDDTLIIDYWTDSQVHTESTDVFLSAGDHKLKVEYYESKGKAVAKFSWAPVSGPPPVPVERWRGEYFNNMTLTYPPVLVRDDNAVNFDWGAGSPGNNVPNDRFSARWTRAVPMDPGRYRFTILTDDGVRLWVNEQLLIDQWHDNQSATFTAETMLPGGVNTVRLDYYEHQGAALVTLTTTRLDGSSSTQPPTSPPAQTLPPGQTAVVVNAQFLNVRSSPESGDNVIGAARGGEVVSLIGRNGGWIKVRLPSRLEGWVGSSYLASNVDFSTLPVVN